MTQARQSIDRALQSMKINATKNKSHELTGPTLTTITQDILVDKNQNRFDGTQSNRTINGRTTTALVNGNSISCIFTNIDFL